jgi:hypothetical protein
MCNGTMKLIFAPTRCSWIQNLANLLAQLPNYRVKRLGINHNLIAQFQVLEVAVEGNDFDDLIAAQTPFRFKELRLFENY